MSASRVVKKERGQKRQTSPSSESAGAWLERKKSRTSSAMESFTKVEEKDEDGTEEEEDDDEREIELSQLNTQDYETTGSSCVSQKEAESGVIDRIQLHDFMCHRKLDVSLSANTNFILGRNGSGKSAIMTAIIVAMGGKATTTHRASSLRNFIRTGAKSAEVIITMRNRGLDSFKLEEYGQQLVVHRTLKDDGGTAYKLKAANGSIVSTKKEELVAILDHWNIQVDNPVSLLDQDTSRHFLHSNNPALKYKLFVKATRLEQIQQDYESAQENQALMLKSIERNKTLSNDLKREAKILEERLHLFDRLKEMEDKVRKLEMELQWAMVMELEQRVAPLEQKLTSEKGRLPRNQNKIDEAKSKLAGLDSLCDGVGKQLEEVVAEAQEVSCRRAEKTTERKRVESEVREMKVNQRRIRSDIAEQSREKAALQQKMEDLITLSQQDTAGERARRQQMLQDTEREQVDLKSQLSEVTKIKSDLETAARESIERRRELESQQGGLKRELSDGASKVDMLQSSRSNQLLTYGRWMPSLVNEIGSRQSQFRRPPKGPIGTMFKLRDYRWSVAIESILGRILSAFIVDNPHDKKRLEGVIGSVLRGQKFQPDILISRYTGRLYDVSRKRPQTQHSTVLDMMEVQDVEIRNVLIDQCNVDTILLIEKRVEAERVVEGNIRGAHVAHTIEGDQILAGRFYANKKRPLGIIRESVDRVIEEEQRRLRDLDQQCYNIGQKLLELQKEAAMRKSKEGNIRQKLSAIQSRLHKVELNLKELRSAEEEEESQEDIATYESEIQECQNRIDEMMKQKGEHDSEMAQLKTRLDSCSQELFTVEAETEQITTRMEEIKAKHSEYEHEKQKLDSVIQHYRERVTEIQNVISSIEAKLADERRAAERAAEEASKVCERMETRRTGKSIESEINKCRRRIEQEEPQAAERERVAREYDGKMELFKKTMASIRGNKMAHVELQKGLSRRFDQYAEFQDVITARACIYFKHYLQKRDYDGMLKFNHRKETLNLEVRVDCQNRQSQATKNTKSLSGGERSFTTVCFIMSLWESIDAPFRCLDEFDVFMDMINRRVSMSLMMECAAEQRSKQFIFLTPQDMSQMGVEMGPHIKVLKLRPPERSQRTLD